MKPPQTEDEFLADLERLWQADDPTQMSKYDKILEALQSMGAPPTPSHMRVWLKSGNNFVPARKAVMHIYGVGDHTWRDFLSIYKLGETYLPIDKKNPTHE